MFAYLFSFQGRSGRFSFFFFFILWALLVFGLALGSILMGVVSPAFTEMAAIAVVLTMFVSSLAITVRRLHDLDLTGWVLAFIYFLWFSGLAVLFYGPTYLGPDMQHVIYATAISTQVFVSVFYMMLLIWPAKDDFNRF